MTNVHCVIRVSTEYSSYNNNTCTYRSSWSARPDWTTLWAFATSRTFASPIGTCPACLRSLARDLRTRINASRNNYYSTNAFCCKNSFRSIFLCASHSGYQYHTIVEKTFFQNTNITKRIRYFPIQVLF